MRLYGQEGLQNHIRQQVCLAHEFQAMVEADGRFEVVFPVTLSLVCFRMQGSNELNEKLNHLINDERKIHLIPSIVEGQYFLRVAIGSRYTLTADLEVAWDVICRHADTLLKPE